MPIMGTFILPHPPIILPEIGKGEEKKIQNTIDALMEAAKQIADLKPDTIVLASPHSIVYSDYFHISPGKSAHGDMSCFGADQVQISVSYDDEFTAVLAALSEFSELPAGTLGEKDPSLDHGTIIPLSFINKFYDNYKLVRIGLSGLPIQEHYKLGQIINTVSYKLGRKVVFIASGDLSHNLLDMETSNNAEVGRQFDSEVTNAMANGDFLRFMTFESSFLNKAAECGLRSFIIMAGTLDRMDVDSRLLSYEGPFGVGYSVASFYPLGENGSRNFLTQYKILEQKCVLEQWEAESEYARLARMSVEYYILKETAMPVPEETSKQMLTNKAGVFVSIKKSGALRGCIGTTSPVTDCIATEIISNAIQAAVYDSRFKPIQEEELKDLTYSVDVLSPCEPITSSSMLDAKKYGVVVTSGKKRGLLLPNLEGIETIEEQISVALQKADIGYDEDYSLERFMVERFY